MLFQICSAGVYFCLDKSKTAIISTGTQHWEDKIKMPRRHRNLLLFLTKNWKRTSGACIITLICLITIGEIVMKIVGYISQTFRIFFVVFLLYFSGEGTLYKVSSRVKPMWWRTSSRVGIYEPSFGFVNGCLTCEYPAERLFSLSSI